MNVGMKAVGHRGPGDTSSCLSS